MFYFTSDYHSGHDNILHLCGRPFVNIQDHDRTIRANHNSIVTDSDKTFNFGDVGYRCSAFYVADTLRQLNGKHIIFLGNHDKPLRQAYERGLLRDMIRSGKIEIVGGDYAIQDFKVSIYKMLDIEDQKVFVGHYAVRTWPNAFRGSWHLFGHSHGRLPDLHRSMDVGVDRETETHKRFFPWSWKEIVDYMNAKPQNFSEDEEKEEDGSQA